MSNGMVAVPTAEHTFMKGFPTVSRPLLLCALFGAPLLAAGAASRPEVYVAKTNRVDRWVTNVVQVQMPRNRFVTEYHTNWVQVFHTNLLEVFSTNLMPVARYRTNYILIDVVHTNWVQAYRTNLTTLHLTNWNTVLVFRTNWVSQAMTNTVQLDLPPNPSPANAPRTRTVLAPAESAAPPGSFGPLAVDARRSGRDVLLSVRWSNGASSPLRVQQWRIEGEGGSFLCIGQDQQFSKALAPGKYKVQVRAHSQDNGTMLAALGTLAVSPDNIAFQQGPARKF